MVDSEKNTKGYTVSLPQGESHLSPEVIIRKRRDRIEQKNLIIDFFVKLISVLVVLWLIFTFLFGMGIMKGEAMYPRLRDGDLFLYYRLESEFHIGDVATFTTSDHKQYVGRIVAKGGDMVDMSEEGELLINDNVQDEEIFYPTHKTDAITEFPCILKENQVFLLCDFRTGAVDSRIYGAVETNRLDGKIITVLRRRGI